MLVMLRDTFFVPKQVPAGFYASGHAFRPEASAADFLKYFLLYI